MVYSSTTNITAVLPRGNLSSHQQWPITREIVVKIAAYSTVLFLSVLGNSLVVFVAKRSKNGRMTKGNNYFLVSLCVSNMFITVCFVPGLITELSIGYTPWAVDGTLGLVLCKVKIATGNLAMAMSFLTTVAISFNWFFVVFFPWKKHWKKNVFYLLFFLVWFGSAGYAAPVIYMSEIEKIHGVPWCILKINKLSGWTIYRFIVLGIIPLVAVKVTNTATILKLKSRRKPGNQPSQGQKREDRATERVFRLILAVIVVFYICFFPYWLGIMDSIYFQNPSISGSKIYAFTAIFFAYLNSAISPWILFVFNRNYNAGIRNLLVCRKRRISVGLAQDTNGQTVNETNKDDATVNTFPLGDTI